MDNHPSEKNLIKFVKEISKLEPIEFMGLAKILNIELVENNEKKTPRTFETVMSEIIDKYIKLSRTQRRSVMKIVKNANLGRVDK